MKKVKEKKLGHTHIFVVDRVLYDDKNWVTGMDLSCEKCAMCIFVEGQFCWHRGFGQRLLHIDDLKWAFEEAE